MNIILDLYKKWGLFLLQKVTKTQSGKQGSNNRKIVPPSQITDFFGSQRPYHKLDPLHWASLEDLVLNFAKGYQPLSSVENP